MNRKNKYIGGEFEINPAELTFKGIYLNKVLLEKYTFYASGRGALNVILSNIKPIRKILLPSYLCSSILQTIKEIGLNYDFYKINEDFSIDESSLFRKLEKKKCDIVLIINYFGIIGQNDFIIKKIKDYDNLINVIEDWSHLSFIPYDINYYKPKSDFVFGSLRKVFAVPDGGFILGNKKYEFKNKLAIDEYLVTTKILGKSIRYLFLNNYFNKKDEIEKIYLKLLENSENYLDKKIMLKGISQISLLLLSKLNFKKIYEIRRQNYLHLLDLFKADKHLDNYIGIIKANLEQKEMPYMMPVYIKQIERNLLRRKLREQGIFCSIIWEIPEEIVYQVNKKMSKKILCIPIDQRYSEIDMEIIYKKIKQTILK